MIWALLRDLALFVFAVGGLALPWAGRFRAWPPAERLMLAVGAALLGGYLTAFGVYLLGVDWRWFWLAPTFGAAWAARHFSAVPALLRERDARAALATYGVVALWCLGWQATVANYSGASWQVDWWEHYDRTHFFLSHWPREMLFATLYPLPARPPLVNLWCAVLLGVSGSAFFNFQIFATLLSTLVVLPLWALARRISPAAPRWLLPMLLASPLLVQNATFTWTKLPAAFFVLVAWVQLTAPDRLPARLATAAIALAGGMLAHYSTGPWILALGFAWLAVHRGLWREVQVRRAILVGVALAVVLLTTWVGWSLATYGVETTFFKNTTVALAPAGDLGERLSRVAGNLLRTVSPLSFDALDTPLLAQTNPLGRWRDHWFILYQVRAPWMCGLAGALVLAWKFLRGPAPSDFAWFAVPTLILLGTAAHTQPDAFGLAHIALQPLALLGLAWAAGALPELPARWRALWVGGLALDFLCGIALHFGVQSGWLDRWMHGPAEPDALWKSYTAAAAASFADKSALHLVFIADAAGPWLAAALLLAALAGAVALWRREMASPATAVRS